LGWDAGTILNGMPYAPAPPKSAWRFTFPVVLMFWTSVLESERTLSELTCSFHGLFAGNIGQPPRLGAEVAPPLEPPGPGMKGAGATHALNMPAAVTKPARTRVFTATASADRRLRLEPRSIAP